MALCLIPAFSIGLPLAWIPVAILRKKGPSTKSAYLLCIGLVTLSVLTPFYHPYARLWLPIEAFGWLLMGGIFVGIRSAVEVAGRGARWSWGRSSDPLPWFALSCLLAAFLSSKPRPGPQRMPLLAPSDSLRQAAQIILGELPRDVKDLHAYARPALPFYLALGGDVAVLRQPDLAHLLAAGNTTSWALLDLALIRQQNISEQDLDRLLTGWTLVREVSTTLNPPTLLDIDPAAAREAIIDASAPLRLLRPKRMEAVR
jgi:dolichyl-phosphate-mannose-protein mannosyltransferase